MLGDFAVAAEDEDVFAHGGLFIVAFELSGECVELCVWARFVVMSCSVVWNINRYAFERGRQLIQIVVTSGVRKTRPRGFEINLDGFPARPHQKHGVKGRG